MVQGNTGTPTQATKGKKTRKAHQAVAESASSTNRRAKSRPRRGKKGASDGGNGVTQSRETRRKKWTRASNQGQIKKARRVGDTWAATSMLGSQIVSTKNTGSRERGWSVRSSDKTKGEGLCHAAHRRQNLSTGRKTKKKIGKVSGGQEGKKKKMRSKGQQDKKLGTMPLAKVLYQSGRCAGTGKAGRKQRPVQTSGWTVQEKPQFKGEGEAQKNRQGGGGGDKIRLS